jgi:hypothetical protein
MCILLESLHFEDMGSTANISEMPPFSGFKSYPEDGGSMYLWNARNTAHIHKVQRLKKRMHINNEPPWKPES